MNVMNGGTIVRVIAALLLVAVVIGLGAAVYNAGVSAGLTEAAQQAIASGDATPVVPVYGYGYGPYVHGPFGWGRWGGRGPRGPNGWSGSHRAEEWHRELHRRNGEASGEGDQRPAGA